MRPSQTVYWAWVCCWNVPDTCRPWVFSDGATSPDRTKADCRGEAARPPAHGQTDMPVSPGPQHHPRLPTCLHSQIHYRCHSSFSRYQHKNTQLASPKQRHYFVMSEFCALKCVMKNKITVYLFICGLLRTPSLTYFTQPLRIGWL